MKIKLLVLLILFTCMSCTKVQQTADIEHLKKETQLTTWEMFIINTTPFSQSDAQGYHSDKGQPCLNCHTRKKLNKNVIPRRIKKKKRAKERDL